MKKLTFLLVVATFLLPRAVQGQTIFQKTYPVSNGNCVRKTSDGNLIITGETTFLLKMDPNGNTIWFNSYAGPQASVGNSVVETPDGGYAVVGTYGGIGVSKVFLFKADSNGNPQWTKTYGGSQYEFGNDLVATLDGGYAIVGNTKSFGTNFDDIYVIKTDSDGNLEWSRDIADSPTDDVDYGKSIVQSSDSSFVICGRILNASNISGDMGVIKLDKNGNLIWAKSYGGSFSDEGNAIISTLDGGYAIAGSTESFSATASDAFLVKTDSDGNLQWNIAFGGTDYEYGRSVKQLSDGSFIVGGASESFGGGMYDFYLTKFDANQLFLWTKTFGGTSYDHAYSVEESQDNGFVMVGNTPSFSSGGLYVVKTDNVGYSGCNEFIPSIGMSFALATVTTLSLTITSPPTVVNTVSFTASTLSTVNTLCSLVSVPEVDPEQIVWENLRLVSIHDLLGRRVNQAYPDNIYIYEYIDDKGRSFFRKVGIK